MKRASLLIVFVLLCSLARAEEMRIEGRVTRVLDGDTIDVGEYRIRLAGIDAPERGQPGGLGSRQFLEAQIYGKRVSVRIDSRDRYGRHIGTIYRGRTNVNALMIESGWAWHFERYDDSEELAEKQREAQEAQRGIWSDEKEPIPPWEWRKGVRE